MKNTNSNALVLFAYRRPEITLSQVQQLSQSDSYKIIVFVDFSETTEYDTLSRELSTNGSVHLILRKKNLGLKRSIEEGLDYVASKYSCFCVLEDDMIVSSRDVLKVFERISFSNNFEVSGFPMKRGSEIILPIGSSWFWGMKSESWRNFRDFRFNGLQLTRIIEFDIDFNYPFLFMLAGQIRGKVDSWAIYKHCYMHEKRLKCEYVKTDFMFMSNPHNGTNSDDFIDVTILGEDWKRNLLVLSKSEWRFKNVLKCLVGLMFLSFRGLITR